MQKIRISKKYILAIVIGLIVIVLGFAIYNSVDNKSSTTSKKVDVFKNNDVFNHKVSDLSVDCKQVSSTPDPQSAKINYCEGKLKLIDDKSQIKEFILPNGVLVYRNGSIVDINELSKLKGTDTKVSVTVVKNSNHIIAVRYIQ